MKPPARPSWRRVLALTLIGCVVTVGVTWGGGYYVMAGPASSPSPALRGLVYWARVVEGFHLYPWLEALLISFPLCLLFGGAGSWMSLWVLQRLGSREGRRGAWRCVLPAFWAAGVSTLLFYGVHSCGKDGLRYQDDVAAWTLIASLCLSWNLYWAWEVARREQLLTGQIPAVP